MMMRERVSTDGQSSWGGPSARRGRLGHLTRFACALAAWGALLHAAPAVAAATLPSGFTETQVAGGLSSPTAMAFAPDGRLFVCQQGGQLRVIKNGVLLPTPFVTLSVSASGERGLLGVAFDPNFASNQFVYVYYTATTPAIHNRVSRFTAAGDVALGGSETILLELDNLSAATNHNGGAMHFGEDGKLYIAVGENANGANSQTLSNLLGKMLRINSDGTIPADNPFFTQAVGKNRAIWALGLRNPYTFAFQPVTRRMFINDVGQNTFEEVNEGLVGANYGWPDTEGPTTNPNFRTPFYYYGHGGGLFGGCAITGGTFYNPSTQQFPVEYGGDYFFADYCGGWINYLTDPSNTNAVANFASGISFPVDLQVGPEGALYYLARGASAGAGVVFRVEYTANQAPAITQHPSNQTASAGQTATFSVAASGTGPLSYQWQRDGVDINGANSSAYTTPPVSAADNGARFRCLVSNAFGSATSNEAVLTVVSNRPPVATITQPAAGALYSGGDTINYAGTGTDPEDGTRPASAFTWEVVFHHDTHTHPFIPPTSGATGGSFTIPRTGETSANVFYRIHLTVADSGGLTHTTFRDVRPRTVTITLAASPSGPQLTLDGQPVATPHSFVGVVGMTRTIAAPSQSVGNFSYTFRSWSDGGAQTHTITTPSVNTTYTASFRKKKQQ
ncbi:MAG TPA: PQQ-dependent sugar dehydrogenase [Pyrinomonadaceae bacterium]